MFDGESRVEAYLYALEEAEYSHVQLVFGKRVSVLVIHNEDVKKAAKWFADIAGKGVSVNPNLLVARYFTDPWATVARDMLKVLKVLLVQAKRHVTVCSPAVVTAMKARMMVSTTGLGLTAVTYGAKLIPTTDSQGRDLVAWPRLGRAAKNWLGDVFSRFGPAAFKDCGRVLNSVLALVSIGAIGQRVNSQDEDRLESAKAFLSDDTIDWTRGENWASIAGKLNANGTFSVGCGKENAHATLRAVSQPSGP